ncbi:MAG: (4Fe-4S)-binding protein [Chloroflexi bacterium RBG_13_51_36]|nr:MAG: (4Fe-4S)-binding protein [Chloroflexi bacterium RBG_13_51_36]
MKEIVVLSGKGGTGKTSIVACFASLAKSKVLADCDVDAADLHLLLKPRIKEDKEFWSGRVASIDEGKCTECGLCQELCRFGAIKDFRVDPISCEGCGFCYHICPVDAIAMKDSMSGHSFISETKYGYLCHARLGIAQENSGKLVALVRQNAKLIAERRNLDYIITDGPPGIGCPVISSLSGANLALLVTEPTLSGIHDLERVIGVCRHFGVPVLVCVNKYDLNEDNTDRIERYCSEEGIEVAARISFDNVMTQAIVEGLPVVEYTNGKVTQQIKELWQIVSTRLEK